MKRCIATASITAQVLLSADSDYEVVSYTPDSVRRTALPDRPGIEWIALAPPGGEGHAFAVSLSRHLGGRRVSLAPCWEMTRTGIQGALNHLQPMDLEQAEADRRWRAEHERVNPTLSPLASGRLESCLMAEPQGENPGGAFPVSPDAGVRTIEMTRRLPTRAVVISQRHIRILEAPPPAPTAISLLDEVAGEIPAVELWNALDSLYLKGLVTYPWCKRGSYSPQQVEMIVAALLRRKLPSFRPNFSYGDGDPSRPALMPVMAPKKGHVTVTQVEQRVLEVLMNQTLATQMPAAWWRLTRAVIHAKGLGAASRFHADFKTLIDPGFRRVLPSHRPIDPRLTHATEQISPPRGTPVSITAEMTDLTARREGSPIARLQADWPNVPERWLMRQLPR